MVMLLGFFFQDPGAEVEYFAFHADHIHEPTPRAKLIFNDRSLGVLAKI